MKHPEARNLKLETRKSKLETGSLKLETGNSKTPSGSSVVVEEESVIIVEEAAAIEDHPLAITEKSQSAIDNRQSAILLPLLLEVGCEEIPARFLRDAEKGLGERVLAAVREARLLPETSDASIAAGPGVGQSPITHHPSQIATFSTPRRLVVHVPALLTQQPDRVEEILGPPVKVAFTKSPDLPPSSVLDIGASASPMGVSEPIGSRGRYTRAARSFVEKNSARLEDLTFKMTPRGEYLALRKTTSGRPAIDILGEILPGAILGLTFPKSMYWTAKSAPRFVRPIRWVVCLLGEGQNAATVEFQFLGVKSSNFTLGHRAKSRKSIPVNGFKDYVRKLKQAFVEIDYELRKNRVIEEAKAVVPEAAGKIVPDEWLTDWIANSTEWPRPMLGNFDERFLHLPREILITVMRDHQRYFALEDEHGNLRPHFVAVLNMDSDEKGLIRQGHERVLTARFRDAEFFWGADQKTSLDKRQDALDRVTYQAQLGSYGDKIRRMGVIASELCKELESLGIFRPVDTDCSMRAISLCKCDLTTQMVQEFPELQGIVGGLYGRAQSENPMVYEAIYDHYLPLGAEGKSPRAIVGAVVSFADKLDSVVAGFAIGREPRGSSDPYALRRQANGLIKVILEFSLPFNLKKIVNKALDILEVEFVSTRLISDYSPGVDQVQQTSTTRWKTDRQKTFSRVMEFLSERLRYYFESVRGFRYDTVRAVMAAGADQPADAQARAEAMQALRGGDDFEALSAAAKRIRNILGKSATESDWSPGEVDESILAEAEERDLYDEYKSLVSQQPKRSWRGLTDEEVGRPIIRAKRNPQAAISAGREIHVQVAVRNYREELERISALRPAVDRFFDKVLVMAEDREVRQNRLRLLKKLDELFSGIAHFAEIEGQ